jgi:hypothetical protein
LADHASDKREHIYSWVQLFSFGYLYCKSFCRMPDFLKFQMTTAFIGKSN